MKRIMNLIRVLFALVVLLVPVLAFAGTGQLVISKSGGGAGNKGRPGDGQTR